MRGRRRLHQARPGAASLAAAAALALVAGLVGPAAAQSDLGGQRVGTSSGTFLKIPIDARSSALAGATSSHVGGAPALFSNPAGLGIGRRRGASFTALRLPADIPAGGAAVCLPFSPLHGWFGLGLAAVGVKMDETDEYHPLGTGREFTYSATAVIVGMSRALTDKLSFGGSVKLFHEAFGPEIDGPELTTWLLDAGAIYFVGFRDARIGLALSNFGPDLSPGGTFTSRRNGASVDYDSFSPPTFFRFSLAIDAVRTARWGLVAIGEVGHPADNREVMRLATELGYREQLFLRSGYDFAADVLHLHAGCGARLRLGARVVQADYAYAAGDAYGDVHRWSVGLLW